MNGITAAAVWPWSFPQRLNLIRKARSPKPSLPGPSAGSIHVQGSTTTCASMSLVSPILMLNGAMESDPARPESSHDLSTKLISTWACPASTVRGDSVMSGRSGLISRIRR
ncbi:MAG TPA: hypothetical protein PKU91_03615, partial [Phycisphaerales bacterium]|nr:hypothetical protein [Phycisphaerales bacterium]